MNTTRMSSPLIGSKEDSVIASNENETIPVDHPGSTASTDIPSRVSPPSSLNTISPTPQPHTSSSLPDGFGKKIDSSESTHYNKQPPEQTEDQLAGVVNLACRETPEDSDRNYEVSSQNPSTSCRSCDVFFEQNEDAEEQERNTSPSKFGNNPPKEAKKLEINALADGASTNLSSYGMTPSQHRQLLQSELTLDSACVELDAFADEHNTLVPEGALNDQARNVVLSGAEVSTPSALVKEEKNDGRQNIRTCSKRISRMSCQQDGKQISLLLQEVFDRPQRPIRAAALAANKALSMHDPWKRNDEELDEKNNDYQCDSTDKEYQEPDDLLAPNTPMEKQPRKRPSDKRLTRSLENGFLVKMARFVENAVANHPDLVYWGQDSNTLHINLDDKKLRGILGPHVASIATFRRQLNHYGWKRLEKTKSFWTHPTFCQDNFTEAKIRHARGLGYFPSTKIHQRFPDEKDPQSVSGIEVMSLEGGQLDHQFLSAPAERAVRSKRQASLSSSAMATLHQKKRRVSSFVSTKTRKDAPLSNVQHVPDAMKHCEDLRTKMVTPAPNNKIPQQKLPLKEHKASKLKKCVSSSNNKNVKKALSKPYQTNNYKKKKQPSKWKSKKSLEKSELQKTRRYANVKTEIEEHQFEQWDEVGFVASFAEKQLLSSIHEKSFETTSPFVGKKDFGIVPPSNEGTEVGVASSSAHGKGAATIPATPVGHTESCTRIIDGNALLQMSFLGRHLMASPIVRRPKLGHNSTPSGLHPGEESLNPAIFNFSTKRTVDALQDSTRSPLNREPLPSGPCPSQEPNFVEKENQTGSGTMGTLHTPTKKFAGPPGNRFEGSSPLCLSKLAAKVHPCETPQCFEPMSPYPIQPPQQLLGVQQRLSDETLLLEDTPRMY